MISSIVIKLAPDADRDLVVEQLLERPGLECGDSPEPGVVPATAEASDGRSLQELHRWVESLPGVMLVDVVFVYFEEDALQNQDTGIQEETR